MKRSRETKRRNEVVNALTMHHRILDAAESIEMKYTTFFAKIKRDPLIKVEVMERKKEIEKAKRALIFYQGFQHNPDTEMFTCWKTGTQIHFNGFKFIFVDGLREYFLDIRSHFKKVFSFI